MAMSVTANALQDIRVLHSLKGERFPDFVASFSSLRLKLIYFGNN